VRGRTAAGPPPAGGVVVAALTKSFGAHPALRGVDLAVPERSVTAILGPSGSGKTTLLRLLAGFDRPDSGTITIGGALVEGPGRHVPPEVRRVGYVPQEGSLFPHLDVKANVGFGLPRSRRRARVAELLALTGMAELADRYPHQLSGGQQQRVALARALAPDPPLVLLDEPFSSLDAFLRASVRMDVLRILRQAGATALVVTHDQDEALSMADQVAVLRDGLVAQCGPPEEVYVHPADASLARFVGDANLLPGTVHGGRVATVFGALPLAGGADLPEGASVVAVLRPEQVRLVPAGDGGPVRGVVVQAAYYGHDSVVVVDLGDGREPVSVRCVGAAGLEPGTTVGLRATGPVVAWAAEPGRLR
jgi:iron(III) transport system ATP-binding protein